MIESRGLPILDDPKSFLIYSGVLWTPPAENKTKKITAMIKMT